MEKIKEFKLTSWSINHRVAIYFLTIFITLAGIITYINIPKEALPDVVIPTIFVNTVYPGSSPKDIENLITKPIEKQIKSISGVKKLTSSSIQDFSNVIVEFNTDVDVPIAKQKVKDAVDKAKKDLPKDMPSDPTIMEVEFSEIPILSVNISGDYDLNQLKKYADALQDKIESLKEITRADMVGALEREIQINVDMYRMQAASLTMDDIERVISSENLIISGGAVTMDEMKRTISVSGEFSNVENIKNLLITTMSKAPVYLKDVAEVKDGFKEQESFGQLNKKKVITLSVIKRGGENLIEASDKIKAIINELKTSTFPKDLVVTIIGDQSDHTRIILHDLINAIIIGFILVTIVLMFFMGATNAIFVGMSVPLSMFIAFLVLPGIGFVMNMIVLFAFLLGLGIVVDDAIVIIENTHRIFDNGKKNIMTAAKQAAGEVFLPVLSGTITTLAPFFPLAFWGGTTGKFMHFMPVTMIITLTASLIVAYVINPVFAVSFMKPTTPLTQQEGEEIRTIGGRIRKGLKGSKIIIILFVSFALLFYLSKSFGMGNFVSLLLILTLLYRIFIQYWVENFQKNLWPAFQKNYSRFLSWALNRPYKVLLGTVALLIVSVIITTFRNPKVVFFPKGDPNFVYVYATLPVGTKAVTTDSVAKILEKRIYKVIGENNPIVESVITNVAIGASEAQTDRGIQSNKAKVGVAFVEYGKRKGISSKDYLVKIREAVLGIPGVEITVDQESGGPPTQKPIYIEVSGDKFEDLIASSQSLKRLIDSLQIPGVEDLKSDLQLNKPEIKIDINRERANREGISTAQIGMEIRNAVFGKEVSRFKDDNDDYPIMMRYKESQRNNIDELRNLKMTYRDMNMGGIIRQVPLSTFASVDYTSTYGGIRRKNQKRVITLTSNVLSGFNSNKVVANVQTAMKEFKTPEGVTAVLTGEKEEQKEASDFLGRSLLISIFIILMILILQFNSFSKALIILSEIVLSIIGVLLGLAIFNMDLSIVMTGIGIVALAGIVVRNGILLVEFTDNLMEQGMPLREAVVEGGRIRMTPVLLTATATILGMIPLAIGFNIDFVTMFTELKPHIYFGGDSVAFWGPLSWTIIFGLGFATFITLILVPVMYLISARTKDKTRRMISNTKEKMTAMQN
ncbi:MAG: efflux RND transporter permease subunit [Bacteroidetes bacterium]|nr:efflux RND transporter permease subunit [Bacteroidota bacterium]